MGRIKRLCLDKEEEQRNAATLGNLAQSNIDVFCWCNRCAHNSIVSISLLLSQLGAAFLVPEIGVHMRCTSCGAKDIAARPAWPSIGKLPFMIELLNSQCAEKMHASGNEKPEMGQLTRTRNTVCIINSRREKKFGESSQKQRNR